jgi:hypothetical protein
MSDINEGAGWWKASDGKFYPPEQHPSVRDDPPAQVPGGQAGAHPGDGAQPHRQLSQPQQEAHVGPQFPDLFQKALEGSHLADNVSLKYDGDDQRNQATPTTPSGPVSRTPVTVGSMAGGGGSGGAVGEFTGASAAKRRWRRGR